MSIDPRTPVIIGVAQVSQTPTDDEGFRRADDPITLMARAVSEAADDSGGRGVLDRIGTMAVVSGLWRYRDPGALIAGELGLGEVATVLTSMGGNVPVHLLGDMAERIAAGTLDVAVVAGGETNLTRRTLKKLGIEPPRRAEPADIRAEKWGPPLDMGDATAIERGGELPRNSYAVFDSALRATRGETLDEARTRAAELWAGYAAVAARNPHAADRRGLSAQAIREPTTDNRFVAWPYTKAMCANNNVDHAGALIICSSEAADAMRVPHDRRVHPHTCVTALDTANLVNRHELATAPGLEAAAAVLRHAEGDLDEIEHLDLYSCFPAIVTLTTDVLGVSTERPLTVTGGLAFAGAALNFAAGESLIGMVHTLRTDPGSRGLVQGNGGHVTKHALGVYSTRPPEDPHRVVHAEHHAPQRPTADPDASGTARLHGATVEYDHQGPSRAVGIVGFADGSRTWATSTDPEVMSAITARECVGAEVGVEVGVMSF